MRPCPSSIYSTPSASRLPYLDGARDARISALVRDSRLPTRRFSKAKTESYWRRWLPISSNYRGRGPTLPPDPLDQARGSGLGSMLTQKVASLEQLSILHGEDFPCGQGFA